MLRNDYLFRMIGEQKLVRQAYMLFSLVLYWSRTTVLDLYDCFHSLHVNVYLVIVSNT